MRPLLMLAAILVTAPPALAPAVAQDEAGLLLLPDAVFDGEGLTKQLTPSRQLLTLVMWPSPT